MAAHQAVAAALPDAPQARQTRPVQSAGKPGEEACEGDGEPAKPELKHPKSDENGAPTPGKTNLFSVF